MKNQEQYLENGYLPTIGIECHVQLKTKTKLFAGVSNDARGAEPNTLISHICLGMPGALPVLNEQAVELATRASFALSIEPQLFSKFDRKHYFYPDLPKGYQITQFDQPIVLGGHVDITDNDEKKRIGVTRAHLEEDAGKNTHPSGADYSLVDLNRAGTPLLEIVSEPDMHSASEARAYAKELYLLMRYADVSDADLYHGNMRFDVNVSVSKDFDELGTRTETKNLNSFKSVEKAVEYEIKRQIELLEKGEVIIQETRGWDDVKQKTLSQRSKEEAHDYRYFPEPDLPPIVLNDKFIADIKKSMPVLPDAIRKSMHEVGLEEDVIETLLYYPALVKRWEQVKALDASKRALKRVGDWFVNEVLLEIKDNPNIELDLLLNAESMALNPENLVKLSNMVEENMLSSSAAKSIVISKWTELRDPLTIAKEKDLLQVSDDGAIKTIVHKVLADNSGAAEDVKKGELKAIGFLVGQVMKESKGKANPGLVQTEIKKQLGI